MAKKSPTEGIDVRSAILGAYHVDTRADIAIVRDLCLKRPGKSRTEAKIMKIVRKINRTNAEAAQLRALLDSAPSPMRTIQLLRMHERYCAEEIKRCAENRRRVFGPRAQAHSALAYELERLAGAAQPIQPSTRVVLNVATLYSRNGAKNLETLCDSYRGIEVETRARQEQIENAILVYASSQDQDDVAYRQAMVCLTNAEEFARDELSTLETRAQNTGYELLPFDNQLIKLLLNSDQPTRNEIGMLIFPEDYKEVE